METFQETVSLRPLSELSRWDRNYRVGDVNAIIASIVRFGFNGVLRVWEGGTVIAGNHSLIALETMRANGAKPPRGVVLGETGEWFVPCVNVANLNRTEASAFAIADNRTHDLGKDDEERLAQLLKEIQSDGSAFQATGYSDADLKDLLKQIEKRTKAALDPAEPEDPDADDFGEVRPSIGELWRCGDHRILCGDSTDPANVGRVLNALGESRATLTLTDPPYAVNYENIKRKPGEPTRKQMGDPYRDPKTALEVLRPLFDNAPSDVLVMTFPINRQIGDVADASRDWEMLYDLVWVKNHFALIATRRYQQRHETIWVFRRPKTKGVWNVPKNQSTVFEVSKPHRNDGHPTMKPVDLWTPLLEYHSNEGDVVFDPYSGSGTTMVVAERLGRRCAAIEIQPRYVEVALRRWEQTTGERAERLDAPVLH